MSTLTLAALLLVPAAVAWSVIHVLTRTRLASRLADIPNERSLHEAPTPRIGGLGLMVGALPFAAAFADSGVIAILAAAVFLCALSFADDLRSLPVQVRLSGHLVAAVIVVLALAEGSEPARPGLVSIIVAVLAIVWTANLFNFMDGSDGLAGGMAAIGFGTLAIGAALAGQLPLMALAVALSSASAGFLLQNFPPARVFMGDAGSVPLGFLAGAIGYAGWMNGAWPLFFPLMVFAPFVADASLTLARRAFRGEPVWKAHRMHGYQRLVLSGWTHRQLALRAYALMLASAVVAVVALGAGHGVGLGILVGFAAAYLLLFIAIEHRVRATTRK